MSPFQKIKLVSISFQLFGNDNSVQLVLRFFQEVLLSSSDSDDEANGRLKTLEEVLQGITFSQLEVKEDSQGKLH